MIYRVVKVICDDRDIPDQNLREFKTLEPAIRYAKKVANKRLNEVNELNNKIIEERDYRGIRDGWSTVYELSIRHKYPIFTDDSESYCVERIGT